MLSRIRKNLKAFSIPVWIATASFVGTIFLVWGVKSVIQPSGKAIATVDGSPIKIGEFYRDVDILNQNLQAKLGANYSKVISPQEVKILVLNKMIVNKLLLNEAKKEGLKVSNWYVAKVIESNPDFSENGSFSENLYERILKANRITPSIFEGRIRKNLLIDKLESVISGHVKVNDDEAKMLYKVLFGKRNFKYKLFLASDFNPKVSDEELKNFYEKNKSMFSANATSIYKAIVIPVDYSNATEIASEAYKMAKSGKLQGIGKFKPIKVTDKKLINDFGKKNFGFLKGNKNYYIFLREKINNIMPLNNVKTKIETMIKNQKSMKLAKKSAESFLKTPNFSNKTGLIGRQEMLSKFKILDVGKLDMIFKLTKGKIVGPIEILDGFIVLKPISSLMVKNFDKDKLNQVKKIILKAKRESCLQNYINLLRNKAKIKVNATYLKG